MPCYAIAFDLDTRSMKIDGLTDSQRTRIYQKEIPDALAKANFTVHPQGSLYHTKIDEDQLIAIMSLSNALTKHAPNFCKYVRRVHVFRMEEWSDITSIISDSSSAASPSAEEELEIQEELESVGEKAIQ